MSAIFADACAGQFVELYATAMRGSLFTGFLTLSGFLLAAKTFIIVNMKKEVYDKPKYKENYRIQRGLSPTLKHYGPLQRLSETLTWNVAAALLASLSQFTVGLIASDWAAGICLSLAALAIVLLVTSLIRIKSNLNKMFYWLEIESNEEVTSAKVVIPTPVVANPRPPS